MLLLSGMQVSEPALKKENPLGMDGTAPEEYDSQSKLLQEFICVPSIDSAWFFKTNNGRTKIFIYSH